MEKRVFFSEESRKEIEALVSIDDRIAPALRQAVQDRKINCMAYVDACGNGCLLGHSIAAINDVSMHQLFQSPVINKIVDLVGQIRAKMGKPLLPESVLPHDALLSGYTLRFERELRTAPECGQELIDILDTLELIKQANAMVVEPAPVAELVGV